MLRRDLARRCAAVLLSVLVVQASGLPQFTARADAAQSVPRVVILPLVRADGAPERSEHRFADLLFEELSGRSDELQVIRTPVARTPARPAAAPADGRAAVDEGQRLLADLKFEPAANALRLGLEGMALSVATLDFDVLVEGYVSLAVAAFRMGDEEGAQAALLSVVRVAPSYRLPEGRYPPIFVREFDKARRRAEKLPRGTLVVEGPAGASVFIDGQPQGLVPVSVDELPAGRHFVKVEGTRGERFGTAVEVKAGVQRVRAAFERGAAGHLAGGGLLLDEATLAATDAAVRAAGAQYGLVGIVLRSADHQLSAATAVYSTAARGFAVLDRRAVDIELLTAQVEVFKLADQISDTIGRFPGPIALPVDLAQGARFKAAGRVAVHPQKDVELAPVRKSALTPNVTAQPDPTVAAVRGLDGQHHPDVAPDTHPGPSAKGAVPWWVWGLVGAGVAAAAGGTYYGVTEASKPVTGTVTARW
jgi:hypothetical protein